MKRKLMQRYKKKGKKIAMHSKWVKLGRFHHKRGKSTLKRAVDFALSDNIERVWDIPLMSFFPCKKTRREGEVTFCEYAYTSDWDCPQPYRSGMLKDFWDKLGVYQHEKKTEK